MGRATTMGGATMVKYPFVHGWKDPAMGWATDNGSVTADVGLGLGGRKSILSRVRLVTRHDGKDAIYFLPYIYLFPKQVLNPINNAQWGQCPMGAKTMPNGGNNN